jgi:hypothetical protein
MCAPNLNLNARGEGGGEGGGGGVARVFAPLIE